MVTMREWGPKLRTDMGRRNNGESKWLRQGGDLETVIENDTNMHVNSN
jgi:hypothetical protein